MATQPIRPALDIPDVKEQLGCLVAELKASNSQLETINVRVKDAEVAVRETRDAAKRWFNDFAAFRLLAEGSLQQLEVFLKNYSGLIQELEGLPTVARDVVQAINRVVGEFVNPTKEWLQNSSKLHSSLGRLIFPLWFFLISTPLAIVLVALVIWFRPAPPGPQPTTNNFILGTNSGSVEPIAMNMTSFSGPAFDSGSAKVCVTDRQDKVDCADPSQWKNAESTLLQFLKTHPNPRAWFLQTGHDRDPLGRLTAHQFGSNHGLARARRDFLNPALAKTLPALQSAALLPPFLLPGYKHETAEKTQDRTPTLYLLWGSQDDR